MEELTCDEFLEAACEERLEFLNTNFFPIQKDIEDQFKIVEKFSKLLLRAEKTNNCATLEKFVNTPSFTDHFGSLKEKICPNIGKNHGKEKDSTNSTIDISKVKREKLSISSDTSVQSVRDDTENMPAPKMPPPKARRVKKEKVPTAKKVKQEPVPQEEPSEPVRRETRSKVDRSSDVILQQPEVPLVDLCDAEEAPVRSTRTRTKKKEEPAPVRTTRTRTKKAADAKEDAEVEESTARTTRTKTKGKRERSESEAENAERKRSKSDSGAEDVGAQKEQVNHNLSTHTEYEDAVSQLENRTDATFVVPVEEDSKVKKAKTNKAIMNETVVIEKSKTQVTASNDGEDLITDDESLGEQAEASPKRNIKQPNLNHVFSPYENSPVKKKVEAFEKFQKNEKTTTPKMNTSRILKEIEGNKGNVREKAKGFVGATSSSAYKTNPLSASKISKYIGHKTSMLNSSVSSFKMTPQSGNDFKERELRRREKEKEQKKKELSKQALTEEKKRKYEEKVQRVQQLQKEALEKEKEKALELQRIKEERYRMVLQQKEEKQRLLKEENERKRLLAKQRAEEKRKEEEALKMIAQEKKEPKKRIESDAQKNACEQIPIYLQKPTPPLPCHDCYDSDDERFSNEKYIPSWASKTNIRKQDYIQTSVGHKIKNTLFCCHSQTIDLREVFQRIDPKKLKRTSSANWDKPPRFTLLPSTAEED